MLDPLEIAVLVAVERLTRGTYAGTEGKALIEELARSGQLPENNVLHRLTMRLRDEGYLKAYFGGGGEMHNVELTHRGRDAAQTMDPFDRFYGESRRSLGSEGFAAAYPGVYQPWAEAESLLWNDDPESHLTTIGHKVREATQAFATALVETHRPPDVDSNPINVEKRLGAVIAMYMEKLPNSRRLILEGLGNLWESTNGLIQRQEHGAQKEGEKVTWDDARRTVHLSMFLMIEFVTVFEEIPPPHVAVLEPTR